jgi:hypothetical protein
MTMAAFGSFHADERHDDHGAARSLSNAPPQPARKSTTSGPVAHYASGLSFKSMVAYVL